MEEKMVSMRDGKKLYVRIYDSGCKNTLLYLHGGPGQGCYTFQYAAKLLSSYMNVVIFDQRGVLRSDKIDKGEAFEVDTLINDCEDLRKALHIDRWCVLGHSFGGYLALLYYKEYPEHVEKVVFENPGFNLLSTTKNICRNGIRALRNKGMDKMAEELEEYIYKSNDIIGIINKWIEVPEDVRSEVYYGREWSEEEEKENCTDSITDEQWSRGIIHQKKVLSDPKIYENSLKLIRDIECPSLLIRGDHDPVLSDEHQDFYIKNAPDGHLVVIRDSGHHIHADVPVEFTKCVADFICD